MLHSAILHYNRADRCWYIDVHRLGAGAARRTVDEDLVEQCRSVCTFTERLAVVFAKQRVDVDNLRATISKAGTSRLRRLLAPED